MAEYLIDIVEERKTGEGKEYKSATLKAGTDTFDRVSIWSDHPDYALVVEGGKITGEVFKNAKGYWNFKGATAKPAYTGGKTGIKAAQDRKATDIKTAQDNKGQAIKIASAFRDATLLLIAQYPDGLPAEWQKEHQAIREWLINDWSNRENLPF